MASNTKQSNLISWGSQSNKVEFRSALELERKLAVHPFPKVFHALYIAAQLNNFATPFPNLVAFARKHTHPMTGLEGEISEYEVYQTWEPKHCDLCEPDAKTFPAPTYYSYAAWLIVSKLWRFCDSLPKTPQSRYSPDSVVEVIYICAFAENMLRMGRG